MGAGQSTEKVVYNETPIQFSGDLVNRLADELAAPDTHPERQSILDHHVRSRIQAEISRLRQEEADVKAEIERALERENIDRERAAAGTGQREDDEEGDARDLESTDGKVRTSAVLREDLNEVQRKVERFQKRRELDDLPDVKAASERLVECYRKNPQTTLDCWKEVSEFKHSVAQTEQKFIETLR